MPHWCIKEGEVFTSVGVAAIFYRLWWAVSCFPFNILPGLGRYICPHKSFTLLRCLFASMFATYPRETIICGTFVVMLIVIENYGRHPLLKHFPEPAWGNKLLLCSILWWLDRDRVTRNYFVEANSDSACQSCSGTFKFKFDNNSSLFASSTL